MKSLNLSIALLILSGATFAEDFTSMEALKKTYAPRFEIDLSEELLKNSPEVPDTVMAERVDTVNEPEFEKCLTLDVKEPGTSPYGVRITFEHDQEWKLGETGMLTFYCRNIATQNKYGASSMLVQYKPNDDNWRHFMAQDLFISKEWKLVTMPFEAKEETVGRTNNNVLNIFFGGVDPQVIQLAGLRILGYEDARAIKELPVSSAYYPGMEPDAAWRAEAHKRIEQHRKADLTLKITDAKGRPLNNADVHVKLKRHRFGFGAAINSDKLFDPNVPEDKRQAYSDILTRTCSKITPANGMKWRLYEYFKPHMDAMVKWGKEHDMTLRGHLFIWPGYERLPDGYDLYKTDPEAFRKDLIDHIHEFANLYPDAFAEWDVMNEPYTEHDFMDLLGKEVAIDWFKAAREANGSYLTYINDYGILSDNNTEHQDIYFDWIEYLLENGAPLDGIGFQGHYRTAIPPEMIMERIDRFAAFGKKMQITEFDFDHTDKALQARFFEDFVTLIYSHPQMSALINWMYLEDPFRPEAALYHKDFTPTSMGKVWERLLTEEWQTEEFLKTDKAGQLELRGFKGLYTVIIQHKGVQSEHSLNLEDGTSITLEHK